MPQAPTCPYCEADAVLTDSAEVYGGRSYGMIWLCRPCQAWVGVHKNSSRHAPLGRLANKELRDWKQKVHAVFDPLWQAKQRRDCCNKAEARNAAYAWLAGQLGIDIKCCHVGMFDVETCRKAVEICEGIGK